MSGSLARLCVRRLPFYAVSRPSSLLFRLRATWLSRVSACFAFCLGYASGYRCRGSWCACACHPCVRRDWCLFTDWLCLFGMIWRSCLSAIARFYPGSPSSTFLRKDPRLSPLSKAPILSLANPVLSAYEARTPATSCSVHSASTWPIHLRHAASRQLNRLLSPSQYWNP